MTRPFVGFLARQFERRLSIGTVLVLGFGALIIIAVVGVLYIGLGSAQRNTSDLVREKAMLIVKSVTELARQHLDPAREQAEYLAELVAAQVFDPSDRRALTAYLTASLAAAPQLRSVTYIDRDLHAVRVNRDRAEFGPVSEDLSVYPDVVSAYAALRQSTESFWGEPIYVADLDSTILNVQVPVYRDDEFLGGFIVSVLIDDLSRYLGTLRTGGGGVAFILRGSDEVLAHPGLASGAAGLSVENPLPLLAQMDDPVMRALWDPAKTEAIEGFSRQDFHARFIHVGDGYVAVYQWLFGYGGISWVVGSYFAIDDISAEFERLKKAALIGLAVLLLAVVAAFVLARKISHPIKQLAFTAVAVHERGPRGVEPLPRSRLFELNAANQAFNEMTEGLRERELLQETFGKYVPQGLAGAILKDRGMLKPHTQIATILFTDIVGFSSISEAMPPERLIALLNEYFSVLVEIVERNRGVIHQFQGDAILATYNLPVDDPEHGANAVRTALEIQQALAERKFGDGIKLATRVGINTGTVVGGTVGAGSRLGFTVHGDDVNLAARIEQMNKQYGTRILVARATVDLLGDAFPFELVGELPVRGRRASVVLYRITGVDHG